MQGSFTQRAGELALAAPYSMCDAIIHAFVVRSSRLALQSLADRHLRPDGCAPLYDVAGDRIYLTFTRVERAACEDGSLGGTMRELEVAFWLPLVTVGDGPRRLVWFMSHAFVDSPHALVSGRETQGFPKTLGQLQIPAQPNTAELFALDTWHMPRGEAARLTLGRLLELRRESPSCGEPSVASGVAGIASAAGKYLGMQAQLGLAAFAEMLSAGGPTLVLLRQLRDIADPERASYQEIVEVPMRATAIHGLGAIGGAWTLQLYPSRSHALASDLGLPAEQARLGSGFWARLDFVVDRGRSVWRLGHEQKPAARARRAAKARKRRLAVIGGGIANLSALFELTRDPSVLEKLEITVYQTGFRLGGKGASGRNADRHQRIEEHGVHVWFGFYDQAFRLMRDVYAALGRRPGFFATALDAFVPQDAATLSERVGDRWVPWRFEFPRNAEQPGDAGPAPPGVLVRRFASAYRGYLQTLQGVDFWASPRAHNSPRHDLGRTVLAAACAALRLADQAVCALVELGPALAAGQLQAAQRGLHVVLERCAGRLPVLRRVWIAVDLGLTVLVGIARDRLLATGFHAIDGEDFRAWLRRHGAQRLSLESPIVRFVYDATFAYAGGDASQPDLAAGVAVRIMLRLIGGYRGSFMYKMRAGMGDVVFAPLYQVLSERGVAFEFFHRARALRLSGDDRHIDAIELGVQATPSDTRYDPLVEVHGLRCWPDRPCYERLREGDELAARDIDLESCASDWPDRRRLQLRRGRDFDDVLLGVGFGELPRIASELGARHPAFARAFEHGRSQATQAAQLWLERSLHELGYPHGPRPDAPVLHGTYAKPFDTWADMSHTLQHEAWPAGARPSQVLYLCGALRTAPEFDPDQPHQRAQALAQVRDDLQRYVDGPVAAMLPRGVVDGRFDPRLLRGGGLSAQFVTANVEPTDRYVLSPAGSIRHRLAPGLCPEVANLALAGDWTRSSLDVGCIEGAVSSGLSCAASLRAHLRAPAEPVRAEPEGHAVNLRLVPPRFAG